jgi:hypothetical protein
MKVLGSFYYGSKVNEPFSSQKEIYIFCSECDEGLSKTKSCVIQIHSGEIRETGAKLIKHCREDVPFYELITVDF